MIRSPGVNVARKLKHFCVSLSLALVASALTSCGSTFVYKDQGVIPQSLFGMTVLDFENTSAPLRYGTTRTWDSFPMLDWADINSAPGVYDFQHLDNFLKINQERNVEVIYTFGRTPLWASSQPGTPTPYGPGQCAPPGDLKNWDNYVTAIAVHAGTRIQYWELWNEPQDSEYYCGDMQTLITMAQHAYRIIKSVNPAALVITPSASAEGGPAWLASYLSLGGGNYADIMSFHGYCNGEAEAINSVVAQYRNVISAHGQGTKPLWDTEADWADDPYDVHEGDTNTAAFIAKYYLLQWSGGVSRFVWYAYDGGTWGGFSTTVNGADPDVTAYNTVQQWMEGASMPSACMHDSDNTWTCPLTRAGGYQALVLWNPSQTLNYEVPVQYSDVRDLSGNVRPLSGGRVPVGESPVLVETAKAF
jgi:polysaccharide biosynthesis protein PslG